MNRNIITSQSIFFRLSSIDNITMEDFEQLKSLWDHDKQNPQKNDIQKQPVLTNRIVCLQSPSLIHALILQYLLFFINPQNDPFLQLIEDQIQKQQNPELKKRISYTLQIFRSVISRNTHYFLKENQKIFHQKNQQRQFPLQKSINSNLPTLEINNGVILALIEFLESSSVGPKLEDTILNFINESLGNNGLEIDQNSNKWIKSTNKQLNGGKLYYFELGKLTQEILMILLIKKTQKVENSLQSSIFKVKKDTKGMQNTYKLMLFPNKNTLVDFISKQKELSIGDTVEEEETKSLKQKVGSVNKLIIEKTTIFESKKKVSIKQQLKVKHIPQQQIAKQSVQIGSFQQKFTSNSQFSKVHNSFSFVLLICLITFVLFGSHYPENPFFIGVIQFLLELSNILTFALSKPLEEFLHFSLRLLYTHDWSINQLVVQ